MINGKKILAIIPARGGSKGIPRKNIKLLAGKPLIAWTIEEAKKSKYIDRLILSSEDEEIIRTATAWGCEVPFRRPKELAEDDTPGIEPVIHAINTLPEKYDYICLLQPTSPLRKVSHIDECIEKCFVEKADSCISITEIDKHPFWMFELNKNKILAPLFQNYNISRRQDLPIVFSINGAIYVVSVSQILEEKKILNDRTIGYEMKKGDSIDIDTTIDFELANLLLKKKYES